MRKLLIVILLCLLLPLEVFAIYAKVGADANFDGDVGATYFYGDGSNLTGVGSATAIALTIDAKEENTSAIVKGQPLYISGATGVAFPKVGLADADVAGKAHVIGLAAGAFSQNGIGLVRIAGVLEGVDTLGANAVNPADETWAAGDILYLSATTGGMTNVEPTVGRVVEIGHSLYGSSNIDAIQLHLANTHPHIEVAVGEDIVLRLGDSAAANKVIVKDYTNTEVANIDSDGNIDGTALTLDTALAIAEGGTGQVTAQAAINDLTAVSGATNEHVLTKDTTTGNAIYKVAAGGGATTFVALTDTPANYTGSANKFLQVNATPDALIFDTISSDDLSDVASIGMLDEAETVTGYWKFTNGFVTFLASDTPTSAPYFNFQRTRDGDPTANVLSGDYLGSYLFFGFHTDGYDLGAKIHAVVDGTPGNADMPGRLEFLTSPDGSATPVLRQAIDNAGNIKMGDGGWTNYVNVSAGGVLTFEGTASINEPLSILAATTSAELAGVISDETGTDKLVYNTSPSLVTPTISASRIRATKAAAQAITTATWTIIQYATEVYDNLGEYDNATNYRFTATTAGYYSVVARVRSASAEWTIGEYFQAVIYKNGTIYAAGSQNIVTATITTPLDSNVVSQMYLGATEYIDIRIIHTQGANVNIGEGAVDNFFIVHRLS